jgi:hypothetical protein
MYKVFPHIKTVESRKLQKLAAETIHAEVSVEPNKSQAKRRFAKQRTGFETPDPLTQTLWVRAGHSLKAIRRSGHAQILKFLLTSELRGRNAVNAILSRAIAVSATIISIFITTAFLNFADSQAIKASETHLAAAQIIGAALALVLSLSNIPAQRAAELFSISVLKLFAKDRSLITVFLVLVAATMLSLLLGTGWLKGLDAKLSLSVQFILLGISFDALRHFYVSTLDLLAPESAIKRIVAESKQRSRLVGRIADKLVAMQVAAVGQPSAGDLMLHAKAITGTNLPETLRHWSSQLEEYAHRFIARRDSNATIETIDALEAIAFDYSELRKKSVTLHIDPEFPFAGALSDISDVLNPVYESIQHIIDDAIASKNEKIVQHSISTMGRMTSYAMSVEAGGVGGRRTAPLAFAASFYLDRAVRSILAANMNDATLGGIARLDTILLGRPSEVELTGVAEQINETLFAVAIDGMAKSNQTNVFRSISAMLRSIKFEIEHDGFDADSLRSTLRRIVQIIPFEVMADSTGNRRLQTFPAYDLGFEASIPMLLQGVVQNVSVDKDREWSDPYSDLSEAMEVIRDHFRFLADVDFKGTLLGKYVADSLDAVCRVLLHELKHPTEGAETFSSTVEDDLKSQITWMSGLFPPGGQARRHHLSDATAHLTILGIDALAGGWTGVARKCADTLRNIASNMQQNIGSYELADIHRDLEILARGPPRFRRVIRHPRGGRGSDETSAHPYRPSSHGNVCHHCRRGRG